MVTNLPPDALAQFRRVVASRTPEEKLKNLRVYLSMIPKHKGTAKLVVQVKRQIAKLEAEIAEEKTRKRHQRSSSIVADITKSKSTVVLLTVAENISKCLNFVKKFADLSDADVQLDTYKMSYIRSCKFNGVELVFLLVDFSSILYPDVLNIARKSDILILLSNSTEELSEGLKTISKLSPYNLFFVNPRSRVIVEEHGYGVSVTGNSKFLSESQVKMVVMNLYKYKGAKVYLSEFSTSYALSAALERGANIKPLIVISTIDLERSDLDNYFSTIGIVPPVLKVDVANACGKEIFLEWVLKNIGKMRIFTKTPLGDVDQEAILLKENGSVEDLANFIHRDLVKSFKYAKVFRKSLSNWVKVGATFELEDRDVVEIRTR